MTEDARQLLDRGLAELGLDSSPGQRAALEQLCALVASWGARMNLSGHRSAEAVARNLVLEAAALLAAAPPFSSLADLGSGAGFPGLPIAVLRPELRVTCVEARLRRHHFQRAARRELGLENVELLRGRAEELEPVAHQAVVAQAMAAPARVLGWMRPWAEPGGWLLLPGSIGQPLEPGPGDGSAELRRYRVPCEGPERVLRIARSPD